MKESRYEPFPSVIARVCVQSRDLSGKYKAQAVRLSHRNPILRVLSPFHHPNGPAGNRHGNLSELFSLGRGFAQGFSLGGCSLRRFFVSSAKTLKGFLSGRFSLGRKSSRRVFAQKDLLKGSSVKSFL